MQQVKVPEQRKGSESKSERALDRLNLSLGDVRDVFEPYLAILLSADRHWNPSQVGIALSTTSIAGIVAQTPTGALVDAYGRKRWLIAVANLAIAISYMVIIHAQTLFVVVAAQAVIGISAVIVGSAVAAISLGLVGKEHLEKRIGRNEAFNHAGNVLAAVIAGLLARFVDNIWVFYFLMILCGATIYSVLQIRHQNIDDAKARGEDTENQNSEKASIKDLLSDRRLLIFGSCVILFYLASAAQLPLISQVLTNGKQNSSPIYISVAIAIAQLIMIPVAAWAGKAANSWGRKPLLLISFAAVTIRALLYTLNHNPWFLISLQILDGIATGIFTVVIVIIVADLTQGTGRFNLAQGAINTTVGIGAALSNLGSGFLVKAVGYNIGFITLGAIASVGFSWFWFAMPETKNGS